MQTINRSDPKLVTKVCDILSYSGLVVYPTETCYGIGVDATNQKAVDKLLNYKSRMEGKPISIAVPNKETASQYAEINQTAENIYTNYLPGPITVVSRYKGNLAKGLASEYNTIGIRIPDYSKILEILEEFNKPITATSANVSYKPNPYSIDKLLSDLPENKKQMIDLIIDSGELPKNDTSTVVDTTLDYENIIRKGKQTFNKTDEILMKAVSKTPQDTENFGAMLILKYLKQLNNRCLIIALGGELGTGKTQLTKGIAHQLGIDKVVKSPTFNIILEYPYKKDNLKGKLIHIDTWRIKNFKELERLKIDNYIRPGNVIVIEWADKFYKKIFEMNTKKSILVKLNLEYKSRSERKIVAEEVR